VKIHDAFRRAAHAASCAVGSPYAFAVAGGAVVVWAICGPAAHYSDTWQLVINTATTVVTFLMVFMIQNTQNRDSRAIHLKLDELIRAVDAARNRLVDVEDLPDEELARLAREFQRLRERPERRASKPHGKPPHGKPQHGKPQHGKLKLEKPLLDKPQSGKPQHHG
jgi:low affinity Fe/Cu permease